MLTDTTLEDQEAVTAAKAAGAVWLDELTTGLDLDAFVVFSSIAATWGSAQQPIYAAANAFLDALVENRRGRGLPGLSVAWGPWAGGGMTSAEDADRMKLRGLRLIDPQLAVKTLAQALDAGEALLTVADVDWKLFAPLFTLRRPSPLIEALAEVRQALLEAKEKDRTAVEGVGSDLAERLSELPVAEQERLLIDLVRAEAAVALGYSSADDLESHRAFSEIGFDSLTGVELRNRLHAVTGVRVPATAVFDYPTPLALAGFLRQAIVPDEPDPLPVLAEIDRLESLLSDAAVSDDETAGITARLESVLGRWKETRGRTDGTAVMEKLESSSDDEIFDFLGEEFGIQ